MSSPILGEGPTPCDLMLIGERPGREEFYARRPFVGPAGQELWARVAQCTGLTREAFYVTNLVKTFGQHAPTPAEVERDQAVLHEEIYQCRPRLIVTVGAHASRFLLPQFAEVNQDVFHGLPYEYEDVGWRCTAVPTVHPSAALREPDRYQGQLTDDWRAVARWFDSSALHQPRLPAAHRIGLAAFGKKGQTLGLDTEGYVHDPQAVSLCARPPYAALTEIGLADVYQTPQYGHLSHAIAQAKRLVIHHAKHDLQVLAALSIDLDASRVDDTMLMAYLLGLPQSLKVLAWRLLGLEMREYDDLTRPLDDTLVRSTLEAWYGPHKDIHTAAALAKKAPRRTRAGAATAGAGRGAERPLLTGSVAPFPTRALTSIRGILDKATDQPCRARWLGSTFTGLVPLPPAPSWRDVEETVRVPYALTDAIAHLQVGDALKPRLRRAGLLRAYTIDKSVLPFLVRNEQIGMKVNVAAIAPLNARLKAEYDRTLEEIEALAGHPLNPAASADVAETLFTELGITPTKRNRGGGFTTGKKHLLARKHEHLIIPKIMHARHMDKLRGTYTEKLPRVLRDGRYYADWKYTRTDTGRMAETMILLVPKDSDWAKPVRNLWVADEGCVLVAVDLAAIEMRVAAHLSQDATLLEVFRTGGDPHADTAHKLLGAPAGKANQDDARHRKPSKILNFGVLMQMTEHGLLEQFRSHGLLDWTEDGCREFLQSWYQLHTGYADYVSRMQADAERNGYVRSLGGRRMRVDGVWSTDRRIRAGALRQAAALPIQSSAIEIAKLWVAAVFRHTIAPRVQAKRRRCEPFVWVHDDITLCVDARIQHTVQAEMLRLVPQMLCVPTLADAKRGTAWGDLH